MIVLILVYVAFISLGLPDALLGASWPLIYNDIGSSIEFAGVIAMVIFSFTILSSVMASKVVYRYGTSKVVIVSVFLTAFALFGFSISRNVYVFILFSVPLGLGAGAIDAALNNFVATHFNAKHMSWLHSFWGIGASLGPFIIGVVASLNRTWQNGYQLIGFMQIVIVILLIVSFPKWKKFDEKNEVELKSVKPISNRKAMRIDGVLLVVFTFLFYCALESGTGLWAASYLTETKGVTAVTAALWTSYYYMGITLGRILIGFIADKVHGKTFIRIGTVIIVIGILMLILPLPKIFSLIGLLSIGFGCAPIYPSMMHLTPKRFGVHTSGVIIGLSMAFGYAGNTLFPPVMGIIAKVFSFELLPYVLVVLAVSMLFTTERINKKIKEI